MIFLIVYDRPQGSELRFQEYADDKLAQANSDRLAAEIEYAERPEVEIVILRSESAEELRKTHARYFKTLQELEFSA